MKYDFEKILNYLASGLEKGYINPKTRYITSSCSFVDYGDQTISEDGRECIASFAQYLKKCEFYSVKVTHNEHWSDVYHVPLEESALFVNYVTYDKDEGLHHYNETPIYFQLNNNNQICGIVCNTHFDC